MNELEKLNALRKERERLHILLKNVYTRMDRFDKLKADKTEEYYNLEREGLYIEEDLCRVNSDIEAFEVKYATPNKRTIYPDGKNISTAKSSPIYSVWDYESGYTAIDILRKMRDNALQMVEDYTDEEFAAKLKKDRYACLAGRLADAILYASELD